MTDNFDQIIGLAAGICTAVSLLPQLVKLIKTKKAGDLSLFYLCMLFVGLGLWIWYGFLKNDLPIILTNFVSLSINATVLFFSYKYKRNADNT